MRIVIAIGGNALLQRGEPLEIDIQQQNIKKACAAISKIALEHEVIITHGNGPQVGLLALQAAAYQQGPTYPFDVLGAESQGMIGYLLAQEFINQLPAKKIVTLLTQVTVDQQDPAFKHPTKFIGPLYDQQQAEQLIAEHSWQFSREGAHFRRVVPSPLPRAIVEIETIRDLIAVKSLVICAGGGGIPVVRDNNNHYHGIEAVIDKDFTTALLAEQLNADRLLLLTDIPQVMLHWGEANATPVEKITYSELEQFSFAEGSMKPKVAAACQFVKNTQRLAHIGLLSEAEKILEQTAGTTIFP